MKREKNCAGTLLTKDVRRVPDGLTASLMPQV